MLAAADFDGDGAGPDNLVQDELLLDATADQIWYAPHPHPLPDPSRLAVYCG